jgi:flagellar biosynthetic protein FlhB
MSAQDSEKSFEPSQKRLDEARKRGDVPSSADLSTAAVYGALALGLTVFGPALIDQIGTAAAGLMAQADQLSQGWVQAGRAPTLGVLARFGAPVLALLMVPLLAACAVTAAQRGIRFAPDQITPKWSRISPVAGLGQKFGADGLFAFGKGLLKLIVICALVAGLVPRYGDQVLQSLRYSAGQTAVLLLQILVQLVFLAFLASLVFGGVDYGWQWLQHRRRNRMTRQEMVDEHKESEGDPHTKGQRQQKGRQIAMAQMLQDVAKADVVLVNPTHYAVALKWRKGDRSAPVCVAKGVDDVAARIRAKAAEAGVPVHRDPPTARAIYATVDIGQPIRPDHYKSVAAAIRFAEAMRKRAKGMAR